MRDVGIVSAGCHIPRLRLQRESIFSANAWFAPSLKHLAKGERAIANWDEDVITMAVEAARSCLGAIDRTQVNGLTLASTSLPFMDRLNAGVVKEAIALPDDVRAMDVTGSQRAATSALIQTLEAATWRSKYRLCLAAELRKARPASEAELLQGDAAAALVIGEGELIARFWGAHSVTIDLVDHYRAQSQTFEYFGEARWVREEGYFKIAAKGLADALNALGIEGRDIAHAAIAIASPGVSAELAKRVGIPTDAVCDPMLWHVGDTGVAHPFLMLAAALEKAKPNDKILVAAFGQGFDVLIFQATDKIRAFAELGRMKRALARRKEDTNYLRFLFHRGLLDLERGIRAEADQKQPGTTLFRNRKAVLGLIGGRCVKTGFVQFPKSDISVNPNGHPIGTQEDYPLADRRARIATYTADNLSFSPAPPMYYGMLDFEGGGRLTAEFTDLDRDDLQVGRLMRMVFRIKAIDDVRSFKRYFWKATLNEDVEPAEHAVAEHDHA